MKVRNRVLFVFLFLLGVSTRLLLIISGVVHFDTHNFGISASIVAQGGNLYVQQYWYNYSPIFAHVLAPLTVLPIPYAAAHYSFLSLVDLAFDTLVYRITHSGQMAVILWLISSIMLYNGQFEALALLPVMTIFLVPAGVFVFGTLGIAIKQDVLPVVWALWVGIYGLRRSLIWLIAAGAVFVLLLTPYLRDGATDIFQRVIFYSAISDVLPGYTYPSRLFFSAAVCRLFVFGGMFILPFALRKRPLKERLFILSLWLIVFMPYGAVEYMLFPLLFAALTGRMRWMIGFGICVVLAGLSGQSVEQYNGSMALVWGMCTLTLIWLMRNHLRLRFKPKVMINSLDRHLEQLAPH